MGNTARPVDCPKRYYLCYYLFEIDGKTPPLFCYRDSLYAGSRWSALGIARPATHFPRERVAGMSTEDQIEQAAEDLVDQVGLTKVRTAGGEIVEMDANAGLKAIKVLESRLARKSGKRRTITSINL